MDAINDLPQLVREQLERFVGAAKEQLGDQLQSVVLYGSGAEGRLRASSDVNLILVLRSFEAGRIDPLREKLRLAHAAIELNVMFVLESEIGAAMESFAMKFSDIAARHRVLHGQDPFADVKISRAATLHRMKQVILNLQLRLRERYALVSLREEQLVPVIAEASGPIRACAATLLGLEGRKEHPKEALVVLAKRFPGEWDSLLGNLSRAREELALPAGEASATLLGLLKLLGVLHGHVRSLG